MLLPLPYVLSLHPRSLAVSRTAAAPVYCLYLCAGRSPLNFTSVSSSFSQWARNSLSVSSSDYSKQSIKALMLLKGLFILSSTGSLFNFRLHGSLENIKLWSVYEETCAVERCTGSNSLPFLMPAFRHGPSSYISLGTKHTFTLPAGGLQSSLTPTGMHLLLFRST